LNGFLAGLASTGGVMDAAPAQPMAMPASVEAPAAAVEEDDGEMPWHDPALSMDERLKLTEGKSPARRLMAAMAQLDCGACGYVCKTYAQAIVSGEDTDLTKCAPGGRETSRKLKELIATVQVGEL